jgi:hypothetical protein
MGETIAVILIIVAFFILMAIATRARVREEMKVVNPEIICPHCHVKGQVNTRTVKKNDGVSGGKVVGGLLTGGVSLLGTGLSQKKHVTRAYCHNCKQSWDF